MAKLTVIWDDSADPKSDAGVKDAVDWHIDYAKQSFASPQTIIVCQNTMINQLRLAAFDKDVELEFMVNGEVVPYDNKLGKFNDFLPECFDFHFKQITKIARNTLSASIKT